MLHPIEKLSMKATTLLWTSTQSEVYTQSYWITKSRESRFWEFQNSHLKVMGQNDLWMLTPWPCIENTIGRRCWFPPSPYCGKSCEFVFVHDLSMHWSCLSYALTNLLFGLYKSMYVIDLLVDLLNPRPRTPTRPSTLEVLRAREHTPTPPSIIFTFGLTIESIN